MNLPLTNRITLVSSILLVTIIPFILVNAEASSIVGTFGDGYELGKKNGQNAYEDHTGHNSRCPPNDSLSYCTGYKAGYEAGWIAASALGDN